MWEKCESELGVARSSFLRQLRKIRIAFGVSEGGLCSAMAAMSDEYASLPVVLDPEECCEMMNMRASLLAQLHACSSLVILESLLLWH